MSNVFLQGQQQMLQQVPFDRTIQPQVSSLPNLPGLQFSNNMLPYTQMVLTEAINQIQKGVTASPARVYFFNIMAANGFVNAQFQQLAQGLAQFIELVCLANNQTPQNVLSEATAMYLSYSVAMLAGSNPALIQSMPQQMLQAMQQTVNDFQTLLPNLQARARGGQPQPAAGFGGGGNVFGGNAGMPQMQMQPTFGNQQSSGLFSNSGPAMGGVNSSIFGNSANLSIGTPTSGGPSGGSVAQVQNAPQLNVFNTNSTAGGVAPLTTAPSGTVTFGQSNPNPPAPAAPAADSGAPARVTQVGDADSVKWVPSAKYRALPTYDPNKEELKFFVYSDNTIQPLIAPITNMDRNQHLAPIAITPKWETMSQKLAAEHPATAGQKDAHTVLSADDLKEVLYPEDATTVATHKESWTHAEAYMLSVRGRYPDKAVLALKYAMLTDTLIASAKVEALVNNLLGSTNAQEAANHLSAALKTAMLEQSNLDIRAINRIVRRLTLRVNRFITVDMSLNFARIDDYVDDAPALAAFLKTKLGDQTAETFTQAHKRIVAESVTRADDGLGEAIAKSEFGACPLPESEGLAYIHLYNNVVYGVLDISTIELRAEVPADGFSALISESSTPLLYNLAMRLFDKKTAEDMGGPGFACDRHLLRLNDGVALEISRAAFAANNFVVALAGND